MISVYEQFKTGFKVFIMNEVEMLESYWLEILIQGIIRNFLKLYKAFFF